MTLMLLTWLEQLLGGGMPGAGFCVAAHVLPSCQVGALDIGDSPAGEERRGEERGGEGRL